MEELIMMARYEGDCVFNALRVKPQPIPAVTSSVWGWDGALLTQIVRFI